VDQTNQVLRTEQDAILSSIVHVGYDLGKLLIN